MRNRLYGGVRGQVNMKEVNTSISVHLLLDFYHTIQSAQNIESVGVQEGGNDSEATISSEAFRIRGCFYLGTKG